MSGIFYSTLKDISQADFTLFKNIGRDRFTQSQNDLGNFACSNTLHNPKQIHQPVVGINGILLIDGWIANCPIKNNDAFWLSRLLTNNFDFNVEVIRSLRGQFSIIWVTDQYVMFFSDFGNYKPLFFNYTRENITLCTTSDILMSLTGGSYVAKANKAYCYDKTSGKIVTQKIIHFNLEQKVNHWDFVFEKFEQSLKDTYRKLQVTTPLSAGYDSSVLAAGVHKLFPMYDQFYYFYSDYENNNVMKDRLDIHKITTIYLKNSMRHLNNQPLHEKTIALYDQDSKHFLYECGETRLDIKAFISTHNKVAAAFTELSYNYMQNSQFIATGEGSDDTFADMGIKGQRIRAESQFGGLFPLDLELEWPWIDPIMQYRNSTLCAQLGRGICTPLGDQELVQAFLNTTSSLKNKRYKGWQAQYMDDHHYPFDDVDKKTVEHVENYKTGMYLI